MTQLPSEDTPLNQHSLMSIESWLRTLGARKNEDDPCLWVWETNKWSAQLKIESEELIVIWDHQGTSSQCSFPYGLTRADVFAALNEGP